MLPLVVLYRIKLPKHQHRLIIIATSGGVLTLTTIVVLWITWYGPFKLTPKVIQINGIIAQLEVCAQYRCVRSLIMSRANSEPIAIIKVTSTVFVANLLVVATFIYRMNRRWKADRARKHRPTKTVDERPQHPPANDRRPAGGPTQSSALSSQLPGQSAISSSGETLTAVSGVTTTLGTALTLTDVISDFTEQSEMNSEYLDVDSQWVTDPRVPSDPSSHSV